jgi:peroxiredoxin
MRFVKALIVAALVWGGVSAVQAHEFGPPVGARLPNIEAQDQNGAAQSVGALAGENGLVLLIARAADRCPFCQRQMIGLEGIRGEIEARGWRLAAITTDTVLELARFTQRRDIGYPILSDEQAEIVRQLDLLDPTQPPGRRHNGLPVPTLLFVSPQGHVLAKLGDADFRVRPTPETVLQTLDGLR